LLVWDKDSYTERFWHFFHALVNCNPHWFISARLLCYFLVSFLIVASASLRLPYLLLYSEHINHIQVVGFLPFIYSSCVCSPFRVWPMSNNITAFVLGL
jgi:hypothetical protein